MHPKVKTFLSITSFLIIFIFFHYFGWLGFIENSFRKVITPISKQIYTVTAKIREGKNQISDISELRKQNEELKRKLKKEKVRSAKLQQALEENRRLKKSLGFFKQKDYEYTSAKVVGRSIQQTADTLIIDKGFNHNIEKGDPAVVLNGVLIGKIVEVNPDSSVIRLLHDNQSKVAVTIAGKNQSIGLLEGGFGINIYLNYIPQNKDISVGNQVISSGLSKKVPRGLVVGTVKAVEKEPYQPFQRAIVKPITSLDKIEHTSIITEIN